MSGTRKRGRRAASQGKLRRETSIEGVIVEQPFAFSRPSNDGGGSVTDSRPNAANNNSVSVAVGSTSAAATAGGESVGDGCYISATVNRKRYYGVMFDQSALKAASELYFQDEANSLELNRRMMLLEHQKREERELVSNDDDGPEAKRRKLGQPTTAPSEANGDDDHRSVQKFRYVNPSEAKELSGPGYRVLLATYATVAAAAEDDPERMVSIRSACQSGGNFVGNYYYQYEVVRNTLASKDDSKQSANRGMRMSMGMETFLSNTSLPSWYPLCNLECGQSKILNMLHMKKNNKGGLNWDQNGGTSWTAGGPKQQTGIIPMEPRSSFRVGIVGAGIAGLSCALEILKMSQSGETKVDIDVTLFEARSRVGGRLNTDRETFRTSSDGGASSFPVDLGASWIHGISGNPLTSICKEAGIDIIASSEEVKMLGADMREVDNRIDKRMGQLFDDMLDEAADDRWSKEEYDANNTRDQKAVRWYASVLQNSAGSKAESPVATDVPPHRFSSDVSIDRAIGDTMKKSGRRGRLSDEECNLLGWYTKNTEYALGSNLRDLSMKYWDTDERHAFDGDHVLLKQGYSAVSDHILKRCREHGKRFRLLMDAPVDKIEYARNTTSHPYPMAGGGKPKSVVNLSDTCCVTTRNADSFNFDFVICALPLGVLKHSICAQGPVEKKDTPQVARRVSFNPPLPEFKRDAIEHVGFGLLNKVVLQFPTAFWRRQGVLSQGTPYLANGQNIFGNASGFNSHHYMFLDVGRSLIPNDNAVDGPPAVLLTLISGSESVATELMSDEDLVNDVLATLRHLFSPSIVPAPVAAKRTKWGTDEYAQGSYTFLPPGTTDEDYHLLQCAINGHGESSLVGNNREVMRLFWAGEHTTSLHPSMAHGAYLSGVRAAQEVLSNVTSARSPRDDGSDWPIPISVFRRKHPNAPLRCSMCQVSGSRKGEGALMAFQRGARQVLVHSHCAEYSPEVGLTRKGVWSNVIKAVNRGKQISCALCGKTGGTIGCQHSADNCLRTFHFSCCEETGWNFERDGKVFFCDLHRSSAPSPSHCGRISARFYRLKYPGRLISCALCGNRDDNEKRGELLGFHWHQRLMFVHKLCLQHSNVVDTSDEADDEDERYRDIFSALDRAKTCSRCQKNGATIQCLHSDCTHHFHYSCAVDTGWKFNRKHGRDFACPLHRSSDDQAKLVSPEEKQASKNQIDAGSGLHAASRSTQAHHKHRVRSYMPSNAADTSRDSLDPKEWDSSEGEKDFFEDEMSMDENAMFRPFNHDPHKSHSMIHRLYSIQGSARISRSSYCSHWQLPLCADMERAGRATLWLLRIKGNTIHPGVKSGDIIVGLNGIKVGSKQMLTFSHVLVLLRDSIELDVEYLRRS